MDFYDKTRSRLGNSAAAPEAGVAHATGLEEHPDCESDIYLGYEQAPTREIIKAIEDSGQTRDAIKLDQLAKAIRLGGRKQFGTATDTDTSDPTNPVAIATGFTDLLSHNGVRIDFTWVVQENNTVFKTFLIQGSTCFAFNLAGSKVHHWQWGGIHSSNGSGVASTAELKVGTGTGNTANLTMTDFGGSVGNLILGSISGIITITNTQVSVSFNGTGNIGTLNGSTIVATMTTY